MTLCLLRHVKIGFLTFRQQSLKPVHWRILYLPPARTMATNNRDPNTLSNYTEFVTVHTTTNLEISFDNKCLKGNVVLKLESTTDAESKEVILDTSFLDINSINVDGEPTKYELSPRIEPYGSPLKIPLNQGVKRGEHVEIDVAVQTTDGCTALQWLTPGQTSNKKFPYMFSQCQVCLAIPLERRLKC